MKRKIIISTLIAIMVGLLAVIGISSCKSKKNSTKTDHKKEHQEPLTKYGAPPVNN